MQSEQNHRSESGFYQPYYSIALSWYGSLEQSSFARRHKTILRSGDIVNYVESCNSNCSKHKFCTAETNLEALYLVQKKPIISTRICREMLSVATRLQSPLSRTVLRWKSGALLLHILVFGLVKGSPFLRPITFRHCCLTLCHPPTTTTRSRGWK